MLEWSLTSNKLPVDPATARGREGLCFNVLLVKSARGWTLWLGWGPMLCCKDTVLGCWRYACRWINLGIRVPTARGVS